MVVSMISAMAFLFALMAGWIAVQRAARRVAEAHPECGPFRLIGGGCGGHGHGEPVAPAPDDACASCANPSCKTPAL